MLMRRGCRIRGFPQAEYRWSGAEAALNPRETPPRFIERSPLALHRRAALAGQGAVVLDAGPLHVLVLERLAGVVHDIDVVVPSRPAHRPR